MTPEAYSAHCAREWQRAACTEMFPPKRERSRNRAEFIEAAWGVGEPIWSAGGVWHDDYAEGQRHG